METRIVIPCTRAELAQVRAEADAKGITVTALARKRLRLSVAKIGRPRTAGKETK